MLMASMPPREATARSFGSIARDVVRAAGGNRLEIEGLSLATSFQPIFCAERGIAIGDEALARVHAPAGGALRTRRVFESRARDAAVYLDWSCRAMHLRNYAVFDAGARKLFLNVHPAALVDDADGGRSFAELARFYGVAPERIVLEVLDSDCGDESALVAAAARHRDFGFSIAMDHFGRGRSNFDRIVALRPRLVKVDRKVLQGALGETQSRRMLPAMIKMVRDAGAEVGVMGIDGAREALAAMESGAMYLQGSHLRAPSRSPEDESLARHLIHSARRLAAA